MIQIGTIAGAIVGIPQLWGNSNQWWIMYAFEGAFQIIVFCLLFPLHETPRYIPLLFILINLNLVSFFSTKGWRKAENQFNFIMA